MSLISSFFVQNKIELKYVHKNSNFPLELSQTCWIIWIKYWITNFYANSVLKMQKKITLTVTVVDCDCWACSSRLSPLLWRSSTSSESPVIFANEHFKYAVCLKVLKFPRSFSLAAEALQSESHENGALKWSQFCIRYKSLVALKWINGKSALSRSLVVRKL